MRPSASNALSPSSSIGGSASATRKTQNSCKRACRAGCPQHGPAAPATETEARAHHRPGPRAKGRDGQAHGPGLHTRTGTGAKSQPCFPKGATGRDRARRNQGQAAITETEGPGKATQPTRPPKEPKEGARPTAAKGREQRSRKLTAQARRPNPPGPRGSQRRASNQARDGSSEAESTTRTSEEDRGGETTTRAQSTT